KILYLKFHKQMKLQILETPSSEVSPQKKQHKQFKKLPPEILCYIFEFLSLKLNLTKISLVCKKWNHLIWNHPPLWNTLEFQSVYSFHTFQKNFNLNALPWNF